MPAAPIATETCAAPLRTLNLFVLDKLFLLDDAPGASIVGIAERLIGLHNKRPQPPYLSVYARLPALVPSRLHAAIDADRVLLRAHCMRGTVHLLPLSRYRTVLTATQGQLDGMYRRAFAHLAHKQAIEDAVLQAIEVHGSLSRAAITNILPMSVDERDLYRLINELCTRGILVKTTPNHSWRANVYDYELLARWQPTIPPGETDRRAAQALLVEWYLVAYGPATLADISWWTGLSQAQVWQGLARCASPWVCVDFKALASPAFVLCADLARLRAWTPPDDPQISLLPGFDPYIMAYASRHRFIDQAHYDRVFKGVAGIIEPVVLLDGRVIGAWKYTLRDGRLDLELFEKIHNRRAQRSLDCAADNMASFLIVADAGGDYE